MRKTEPARLRAENFPAAMRQAAAAAKKIGAATRPQDPTTIPKQKHRHQITKGWNIKKLKIKLVAPPLPVGRPVTANEVFGLYVLRCFPVLRFVF